MLSTGQTKLCHHPPPSITTQHHPPPAKTYSPPPITTHHQPKYIHHQPLTTHHQPRYIHQHLPPPTNSQNLFFKKPIYKNLQPLSDGNVRNLNSRPAIAKKLFYTWPSTLFLLHTQEMVLKSCSVSKLFILCETGLLLKKDKCLSVLKVF